MTLFTVSLFTVFLCIAAKVSPSQFRSTQLGSLLQSLDMPYRLLRDKSATRLSYELHAFDVVNPGLANTIVFAIFR